jgi:hypothetical protein
MGGGDPAWTLIWISGPKTQMTQTGLPTLLGLRTDAHIFQNSRPQNPGRQKGDNKQGLYWGPTNIWHRHTKFSRPAFLRPWLMGLIYYLRRLLGIQLNHRTVKYSVDFEQQWMDEQQNAQPKRWRISSVRGFWNANANFRCCRTWNGVKLIVTSKTVTTATIWNAFPFSYITKCKYDP